MSDSTIEEIKGRLNIVELISTYVRLEKAGTHYKACCPFHQERSPSFMVNEEKNMWHCFGCGKGGDVFAFVMEIEGLEFREALVLLAEKAGVELPKFRQGDPAQKDNKERLFALLELATKFYEKQLWDGAGKEKILGYLRGRGLSDESIRTFRLGYAPDGWRHQLEFFTGKGFTVEEMEQVGLVIKKDRSQALNPQPSTLNPAYYDRFRDRIMFPIFDIFGHVIGYSARVAPGGDEGQAKYINTPETTLYHKSRALYGLFHAKQAMKQAGMTVIVEGNMDVIAMHQAGIAHTVAVSGTALTDEQLNLMKRYGKEVRLFFDMDGAGQKAARKSAELALEKELIVTVVAIPFGKDAADMGQDDPEKLREMVAQAVPVEEYFLSTGIAKHDITTALGKRQVVDEYVTLLQAVKNPIERAEAIKALARAIDMDERLITGMISKIFLEQSRRDGPAPLRAPEDPFRDKHTFGKRSELLRDELIALMFVDEKLREHLRERITEQELQFFFEQHPLFFFLVQAGEGRDPAALIEDQNLKKEVVRLSFHILESPEVAEVSPEEREKILADMAERYLSDLYTEVTKREKLISLEKALDEARAKNDKELEKRILTEFVVVSGGGQTPLPS
jgi:DNA primase